MADRRPLQSIPFKGFRIMEIVSIEKSELERYSHLLLPYIYEDLIGDGMETDTEYFGLAAIENGEAVSALVIQPEATGDLNIVSVYTLPEYRRRGFATELLGKSLSVARALFKWEEGETEELIILKTLYSLPPDILDVYENFLIKNHFRDFVLLKEAAPGEEDVWSGSAEIRFFREV
ncbi:MAG: GNAT family N-acetyltransferase [Lachnospiraceae bacterium]|nr:GNAT family N-acetyltransferase [Lachnospiraceae bacterium]